MLALERQRRLLDYLNKQGSVRTADVARMLGVTEETVRRDFEKLEAEGVLHRSHGGAVRLESNRRELSTMERERQNAPEKRRIARAALEHIKAGSTVFFDASTTVLQLAQFLPDQAITVVTNSLQVAMILAEKPSVNVVVLGGNLKSSSLSCVGWPAEQTLDLFRIDTAFFSCRGIDPLRGLSDASEDQARVKRRVVEHAAKNLLLADHSKAGVASSYFYIRCTEIDLWITDRMPEEPLASELRAHGLPVEVAP